MTRNEWVAAAAVILGVVILASMLTSWKWAMLALGIGSLGALWIPLFPGKRMREMDRQLKETFTSPTGQDWGKITGTFVGGKLVSIETQQPSNPVEVKRSGIQGCTIERGTGTVPPLTVRNKKKSDLFPMSIDEALARYGPPKGVIYTSRKKSDSLLGHQITGSREGEERQAASEEHHPACFPDGEDTRACHPGCRVRSGGQNAETE